MTERDATAEAPEVLSPAPEVQWPASGEPEANRRVGLAVGIVLLIAAIGFAVFWLFLRERSPESVVEGFFSSIGSEDFLGMAESIAPSEHRFITDPMFQLMDEAERLGFIADLDREEITGLDFQFTDMTFTVVPLTEDLVWVDVDGVASSSVDPAQLPVGPLIDRYLPDDWREEVSAESESAVMDDDFGLAVVKENGDWFVSITHTIAEAARVASGEPFPASQPFAEPTGAESAEAALEQAVRSLVDLDVRGFVDVIAPGETAAFRMYAGIFMDEWDANIEEARRAMDDAGFTYSLDAIDLGSTTVDDVTLTWIEDIPRFSAEIDNPEVGRIAISRDGDCVTVVMPGEIADGLAELLGPDLDVAQFDGATCVDFDEFVEAQSVDADPLDIQEELLYDMPVMGPLLERWLQTDGPGAEPAMGGVQFVAVESDGAWYVSPFGSMSRWFFAFTATLDQDILEEVGDEVRELVEQPDLLEQRFLEWAQEAQAFGAFGPSVAGPIYGPDVLAPFANQRNVLLAFEFDVDSLASRIEVLYGDDVVLEQIDGSELFRMFESAFGPDYVSGYTADTFPHGVLIDAVDVNTLVEIFNWFEVFDMYRASDLGL